MNKSYVVLLISLVLLSINQRVNAENFAPQEVSGARTISTATASLLLNMGYPFVDVRGKSDFDKGHLPEAHHLSVKSDAFTAENLVKIAAMDHAIVFYCNGVACMGSAMAAEKAVRWGWQKVFYYREGYKGWREAGY